MELTKEQAIDRTIELWTWLAETEEDKEDWPQWERNGGIYAQALNQSFLCEFDYQSNGDCEDCPYWKAYGIECIVEGEPFGKWDDVKTPRTCKKYAKEFLAKIVALKETK